MNRPEGISESAWDAASELLYAVDAMPSDGNITIIAKAIQSSVEAERAVERARCVAICELWLLQYGHRGDELEHTTAQEWANGAVQDIAEHIRKGA